MGAAPSNPDGSLIDTPQTQQFTCPPCPNCICGDCNCNTYKTIMIVAVSFLILAIAVVIVKKTFFDKSSSKTLGGLNSTLRYYT